METMFDTLLQLPLFQGLAHEDFTCILEKVKLHFTKHKAGEVLLKKNTPCHELIFVLKGEVTATTSAADDSYTLTEYLPAPLLIEPQPLFGMKTSYASTYLANTEVYTVSIGKTFALKELFSYDISRLNYMNIISNRAQMLHSRLWSVSPDSLEARISCFLLSHAERPSGRKELKIKMEDLAQILNETRISVSKALNEMQEKGLVELHRGGRLWCRKRKSYKHSFYLSFYLERNMKFFLNKRKDK